LFSKIRILEHEFLKEILPEVLWVHFELTDYFKLGNILTKAKEFELHLEEKNELPPCYSKEDYKSKGFQASTRIQDFPLRGKAVYLVIRRRKWLNKLTKQEIRNDYSFISKGAKLTKNLSDFLKGTGRDPSRYDK
jgi:hypothetical protein